LTHNSSVIIVGSGPAGYTSALYCARAELQPLVFEGAAHGGALMNTTEVENFPGFPGGTMGPELMANMRAQALRFGAELLPDDVVGMELKGETKVMRTATAEYTADAVILAMGSAYRTLGIPREPELSGYGVSWCATCDGFFFRGKDIAVVGGGDTAMEEAMFLTRFAKSVTVIHRRDQLRASRIMAERAAANEKIRWIWNAEVTELRGADRLEGVILRDCRTASEEPLAVEGLFIAIGHLPRSELVVGQVDVDHEGYVKVAPDSTVTSVPGVFAAGDLVDHTYRQAITAAGTGCAAAIDAERFLAAGERQPVSGTSASRVAV
jgi:thioredoxin reductase (NADPH)